MFRRKQDSIALPFLPADRAARHGKLSKEPWRVGLVGPKQGLRDETKQPLYAKPHFRTSVVASTRFPPICDAKLGRGWKDQSLKRRRKFRSTSIPLCKVPESRPLEPRILSPSLQPHDNPLFCFSVCLRGATVTNSQTFANSKHKHEVWSSSPL